MADYTLRVKIANLDPVALDFADDHPDGDVHIHGDNLHPAKTIEIIEDPSPEPFKFIGIRIAKTYADLANAPKISSGDYPNTPFDGIQISAQGSTFSMVDHVDNKTWHYGLGIHCKGEDHWPDPKIYNTTGGPGGFTFTIQNHLAKDMPLKSD